MCISYLKNREKAANSSVFSKRYLNVNININVTSLLIIVAIYLFISCLAIFYNSLAEIFLYNVLC